MLIDGNVTNLVGIAEHGDKHEATITYRSADGVYGIVLKRALEQDGPDEPYQEYWAYTGTIMVSSAGGNTSVEFQGGCGV